MSVISAPIHGKKAKTEKYVVARRSGNVGGSFSTTGYVYCDSCGASITKGDLARYMVVTLNHLNRFLNRENLRPDVAERIRSKLLRVEE